MDLDFLDVEVFSRIYKNKVKYVLWSLAKFE